MFASQSMISEKTNSKLNTDSCILYSIHKYDLEGLYLNLNYLIPLGI